MSLVLDGTNGITTNSGTVISASTIGVGGTTPSTSGAGITFPATQSASTDANTLDDYEEGTCTVTLTSATPPSSPPTTTAYYTKTGRMVTLAMRFGNVNTSGGSGGMYITGLPFTPTGTPADCYTGAVSMYGLSWTGSYVVAYVTGTAIYFLGITSGGAWTDTTITAGTSKYLQFSITYQVA